jgi:hypothetical protein
MSNILPKNKSQACKSFIKLVVSTLVIELIEEMTNNNTQFIDNKRKRILQDHIQKINRHENKAFIRVLYKF